MFACYEKQAIASGSLEEMWARYIHSNGDSVRSLIDKRDYVFFVNAIPPGSRFAGEIKVKRTTVVLSQYGQIVVDLGGFTTWLAAKKEIPTGNWLLTLDEKPILDELTKEWAISEFAPLRYHTPKTLSVGQREEAVGFLEKVREYEKLFGYSIPAIDYYSCPEGPLAESVIGEKEKGAGKARHRLIKAVDQLVHAHELAHVFALEIGFVGPFFDEGIATALGSRDLIADQKSCKNVKDLLKAGLDYYLKDENFVRAHIDGKNVYGLAQLAMQIWIKEHGFERIKDVLRAGVQSGGPIKPAIEKYLGPISRTEKAIKRIIEDRCK